MLPPIWQPTHLEDDLVKLIPLTENDFDILFEVASDPLIWEQHPKKDRYKREVFIDFFNHAVQHRAAFLIQEKATGKIIGSSGYYDFKPDDSSIVIGYTFFARPYWGGLYNKASKNLLLNHAFKNVNKVYFHIGADNKRSQIAIERIGAKKIRTYQLEDGSFDSEYIIEKMD